MLLGVYLSLSIYLYLIQRANVRIWTLIPNPLASPVLAGQLKHATKSIPIPPNVSSATGHDCAIYWLRLPKTASTTIMHSFMGPLLMGDHLFANTDNDPNTCIQGVGGCTPYWKGWRRTTRLSADASEGSIHAPPYGAAAARNETHIVNNDDQRCFPVTDGPSIKCHEYDQSKHTLDFGPHGKKPKKPKANKIQQTSNNNPQKFHVQLASKHVDYYAFGPALKTHVGLDPSLFGWIFPKNPLVFSTFRDPVERLLSSFHYGMKFGAGRPGEVTKCTLPGVNSLVEWQDMVVNARKLATLKNDTHAYQQLLGSYLNACRDAVDNTYVQFLDPYTKDVTVALANLEQYVIVGLQSDIHNTLERWRKVTLQSCASHPHFRTIQRVLAKGAEKITGDTTYHRKSTSQVNQSDVGDTSAQNFGSGSEAVDLVPPDISLFGPALQQLVRKMTAGDELVYRRVLDMYKSQQLFGSLK